METKKVIVDFRKVPVVNIDGKVELADISKTLGNLIFSSAKDIEEDSLSKDIYHNGEIELTEKNKDTILESSKNFAYFLREAIKKYVETN